MRADIVRKCFERGRRQKKRLPKRVKRLDPRIDWEEQDAPGVRKPRHTYIENGFHCHVLKQYVKKQVGRHWDDVYSEIVEVVRGRSYSDYMVRRALTRLIETEVYMVDGEPFDSRYHWSLAKMYWVDRFNLYRNPDTGVLSITCKLHSVKLGGAT